jgi:hypothetical protein
MKRRKWRAVSGDPRVSVMQPTRLRNRDHLSFGGMLHSARHRSVSIERQMCSRFVVVSKVKRQNPHVERLTGILRRECLDYVIVLNE